MEEEIKKIIEENPVAVATVKEGNKPHVIAVACVKIENEKIIITNNYMKTTVENIQKNPRVSLAVWDKDWNGYRIDGSAEYHEKGEYYDLVKSIEENKKHPCKGAIVIKISEVKKLG
ncbi:MAG: pyridoxamine 5'-phosphate oxidase family protein [Nanoarchaeota archaeon]|nr:pyridoxamine 5'-phosphate oxidase family protein [Nanoarchaeota archaeon]MBU0976838.1 pyridoxamine 5'-phosphate oxidase family protein [Nanoarchaeota archaeon]